MSHSGGKLVFGASVRLKNSQCLAGVLYTFLPSHFSGRKFGFQSKCSFEKQSVSAWSSDNLWVRTDPAKGSAELHPGILSMKVLISYFHPFKLFMLSYFHISLFFSLAFPCNVLVSKEKRDDTRLSSRFSSKKA